MADVALEALPWQKQVEIFQKKNNVPSEVVHQVYGEAHDTSFTVAGMTKAGMLESTHNLVNEAVAGNITMDEFKDKFKSMTDGWKGSNDWRARIVYETNVRTAYSAGLEDILTQPQILQDYPYWQYLHSHASTVPRPLHLSWDKLVIPANSPWWQTHTPPGGFGCKCTKRALSLAMLAEAKLVPTPPPDDGSYTYTDPNGQKHTIPNGIDPGWDYTPGQRLRRMQEMLDRQSKLEASKKYLAAVGYATKQINEIRNRYMYQLEESRWERLTESEKKKLIAAISKDITSRQTNKVFVDEGQRALFKSIKDIKDVDKARQILTDLLGIPKYSGSIE